MRTVARTADVEIHTSVSIRRKAELLAGADATLVPIQRDEPFGLVMVESMACGTPVIAYRRGAASEVLIDEETGFLVEPQDADAFAAAVDRVGEITPTACREHVESYFSTRPMLRVYLRKIGKGTPCTSDELAGSRGAVPASHRRHPKRRVTRSTLTGATLRRRGLA